MSDGASDLRVERDGLRVEVAELREVLSRPAHIVRRDERGAETTLALCGASGTEIQRQYPGTAVCPSCAEYLSRFATWLAAERRAAHAEIKDLRSQLDGGAGA